MYLIRLGNPDPIAASTWGDSFRMAMEGANWSLENRNKRARGHAMEPSTCRPPSPNGTLGA
jgi:hypothetical protein